MLARLLLLLFATLASVMVAWIGAADPANSSTSLGMSRAQFDAWFAQRHELAVTASKVAELESSGWVPRQPYIPDVVSEVAAMERVSFGRRGIVWYERARYVGSSLICGTGWPENLPLARRVEAGWPFSCLSATHCELTRRSHGAFHVEWLPAIPGTLDGTRVDPILPYDPIWFGLGANVLVYYCGAWMLVLAPRTIRRSRRRLRGMCPMCAYPVGSSHVCTECGHLLGGT